MKKIVIRTTAQVEKAIISKLFWKIVVNAYPLARNKRNNVTIFTVDMWTVCG